MVNLSQKFENKIPDWRKSIRENQRRTFLVMVLFVSLYVALGFLIDLFINSERYPHAPISLIAKALFMLQLTPYATIITAFIAIISLWVAIIFSDKLMLLGTQYHEITANNTRNLQEKQLYNTVEEMKVAAGLRYMPKIYIIEADYMNAFASGYSEKSAMMAITQGLLDKLDRAELQAVMAHELSHIRHLDIKLTLMASVLANLMLILIDVLFYGVLFGGGRRGRDREGGNWLLIVILILRYVLPLITVLLMLLLSRTREYMADAGAVELMRDNDPLARALLKISGDYQQNQDRYVREYQNTPHEQVRREAYIFDPITAGISQKNASSDFFSTHPSIEKRLAAIGYKIR